jgi:hypothetical protein
VLFSIMDGDDEDRVDAPFSPVPRPVPVTMRTAAQSVGVAFIR